MKSALTDLQFTRYGQWSSLTVALGHLLVPTTQEALAELQPEGVDDCRAVFDVRVDNRAELLAKLGMPLQSTDSQLFLEAYRRWGNQAFLETYGDFAAAIWIEPSQTAVFARDPSGCKPLYFVDTQDWLLFASDARALLAVPGVSAEIDYRLLAHQTLHYDAVIRKGFTPFPAIRFLPPGHVLTLQGGQTRISCYWKPEDYPEKTWTDSELDQAPLRLRQLLDSAVECRLRSNGRVAAHLSGGLDSSSIAVLAARKLKDRGLARPLVTSWSPGQDEARCEDHRWIEDIVAVEDLERVYSPMDVSAARESLKRWLPLGAPHPLMAESGPARLFQVNACRVVLSGWGGDQVASHGGEGHFSGLFRRQRWHELYIQAKELAQTTGIALWRVPYLYVVLPHLPQWVLRLMRRLRPGMYLRPLNQPLLASLDGLMPASEKALLVREDARVALESSWQFRIHSLKVSAMAARCAAWANLGDLHGLEYRYPLLDRRILEFGLSLPGEAFLRRGVSRHLFREASAPWLPDSSRLNTNKAEPVNADQLLATVEEIVGSHTSDLLPAVVQMLVWMKLNMQGIRSHRNSTR